VQQKRVVTKASVTKRLMNQEETPVKEEDYGKKTPVKKR
jgi:hypothetical protein